MSVFRVKLTDQFGVPVNPSQGQAHANVFGQGNLDEVGQSTGTSIQRTMFAQGPGLTYRKLNDGDTFTDCNFWKRYSTDEVSSEFAFIEVVSDDGSVYIDGEISTFPRVETISVAGGSTFATDGQSFDILTDAGGPAVFTQIEVTGNDVEVRINGLSTAVKTIAAGDTQVFQLGELQITLLEFRRTASGSASVVVTVGVESTCNS